MTRSFIALLLLITAAVHAAETNTPERILVPRATKSPRVDGKLGKNEWSEAKQVALADGGQAYLLHDGKHLFVALVGKKPGIGSACVRWEKAVYVLHASAALGTIVYSQKDGKWMPNRDAFQFSNRDTTDSQKGIQERKQFLSKQHWFANTHPDGLLQREYQIQLLGKKELQLALAITSFVDEDDLDLDAWPSTVKDDCVELDLTSGYVSREFKFQPETWAVVVMR